MTGTRPFTDLLALEVLGGGPLRGDGGPPHLDHRTKVHGGCMMAVCAAAARRAIGAVALQPIAVSANYLHAPDPGAVTLTTTVRKRGRQVCVVDVELRQRDRTAVSATVTLGGLLDVSAPRHQEPLAVAAMASAPPADAIPPVTADHPPMGQIVHVARGCDLRVDPSAAHYLSGRQGDPINRMWLRPFADDEADTDTSLLFALMAGDISAPVTMNRGMLGWAPPPSSSPPICVDSRPPAGCGCWPAPPCWGGTPGSKRTTSSSTRPGRSSCRAGSSR